MLTDHEVCSACLGLCGVDVLSYPAMTVDVTDGLADEHDCAPLDDLVFGSPGEAGGLFFVDAVSLSSSEDATGAATSYRLDRGNVPPTGFDGYDHACIRGGLLEASAQDTDEPTPDEAFYYLALFENGFGAGSPGAGTAGERPAGEACP